MEKGSGGVKFWGSKSNLTHGTYSFMCRPLAICSLAAHVLEELRSSTRDLEIQHYSSKGCTQTEGKDFQVHDGIFSTMKRHNREAVVTCYAQTGNKVINI